MRRFTGSILALMLLPPFLTGCQDSRTIPAWGERVPAAVSLGKITIDLPVGHKAGSYERSFFGEWADFFTFGLSHNCVGPYHDVAWIAESKIDRILQDATRDGVGASGLVMTAGSGRVLTGRLMDVRMELCREKDFDTNKTIGTTGSGLVQIDWEVSDPPGPVKHFTTYGDGKTDIPSLDGKYGIIIRNAVADAARKLGSIPEFRELAMTPGSQTRPGLITSAATVSGGPIVQSAPAYVPPAAAPAPVIDARDAPPQTPVVTPSPPAIPAAPATAPATAEEAGAEAATGSAIIRWGQTMGVVADATGLALLPDTGANVPESVALMLGDGRVANAVPVARAFGFLLLQLPAGNWPAMPIRRQRPPVSRWLHRMDGDGGPVAMVSAHTGPAQSQEMDIPALLLDLNETQWRNPPWMLVDEEGRLAALRGARTLPGDPAPYYAPAGVMAYFRAILPPPGSITP